MNFKKVISIILVAVMALVMITGCSSNEQSNNTQNNTNQSEKKDNSQEKGNEAGKETENTDPEAAKYGGILVEAEGRDLIQTNFMFYSSTVEGRLEDFVFDKLVATDPNGEIVPRIAESWETDDNKTWIFHLRKDVKWQDGEQFTADDIVFFVDFFNTIETTNKSQTYDLTVTKVDDYTVKVELPEPNVAFLYDEFTEYCCMTAEHIWSKIDRKQFDSITDVSYFVGTGPFKITKIAISEEVVMERNDLYWDGKPYLDGVVMRIIPDSDAKELAFENGEVNLMRGSEALAQRTEGKEGFKSNFYLSGNMNVMLINHKDEILSDLNVRKALSYLINRDAFKATSKQLTAETMVSCFTSADKGYNKDAVSGEMAVYDPEKAAQILEEDGWKLNADGIREKNGVPLHVELMVTSGSSPVYQIFIESCKSVGFDLQLRVVDKTTRNAAVFNLSTEKKDFQLFLNAMTLGPSPMGYAAQYGTEGNYLCYTNPEVEQAYKDAAACSTLEEAQPYFDKIQKLMTDDVAAIWITSAKRGWSSNKNLNTDDCGMSGFFRGWVSIGKAYFEK